ncbi:DUF4332 domain-containing protein [Roseimaritima sediminicola]|uniref:DUF4332 domain-containing protein n=1 Tax=Roseimaritima sediminicola TaxID=2662066 RepID=UPI0012985686|nr:DUF4332 domain-containing protein [Roseimaritima sediminicola]
MRALISLLRAAHCRSTHHFFAIDALAHLQSDPGRRLGRLLLRHFDRYLAGAKDPDTRFRDFHNHVVHVTDGYWGGAPAKAIRWYERLQRLLQEGRYAEAAHAMGVLSHYFTDPLQPLHTAQSDREQLVHRPMEWSITKSYESILGQWHRTGVKVQFQLSEQPGWLAEAILHGARIAHTAYDPLIQAYNLEAGVKDPPRGLNAPSRQTLAELFALAITGLARVIDRAGREAEQQRGSELPPATLSMALVMAGVKVPHRLLLRRIERRDEQRAVEAILAEHQRSGTLRRHVPEECKTVRRSVAVYHRERRQRRQRERTVAAGELGGAAETAIPRASQETYIQTAQQLERQRQAAMQRAEQAIRQVEEKRGSRTAAAEPDEAAAEEPPATIPFRPRGLSTGPRLSVRAPIVDAPSIGPKTAARLQAIGIETVGDLLEAGAESTARRLATRWIDSQRVEHWQAQSRLMCSVPGLLARDVKLLVGSGCRTPAELADSDADALHKTILRFAATSAGRRALRGAEPPTLQDVQAWLGSANPSGSAAA